MKRILTCLALTLTGASMAQNNLGDIIGQLIEGKEKYGIPGVQAFTTSGESTYRAFTDEDGRFRMSAIPSGQYQISFVYQEDTLTVSQFIEVTPDGIGDLGTVAWIENTGRDLPGVEVTYDPDRLHLKKGAVPELKISALDIKHSPARFDPKAMIMSMSSEVRADESGELVFRGARAGDMICYLDGIKLQDVPQIPSAAYKYIMVYTGAIPAKYGDTNGGVVVIETTTYTDLYNDWKRKMNSAKLKD